MNTSAINSNCSTTSAITEMLASEVGADACEEMTGSLAVRMQ